MADDWGAFNPQPVAADPWAAFKSQPAAAPPPESGIDIDRASPFVSSPSEAGFAATVPDAFLDRLRRGQALGRILNETVKGAQEGFGEDPIAGTDAHLDHIMRELAIQRDDPTSKASPLQVDMVAAGVAGLKALPLSPFRAVAGLIDATTRGINSGLHAAGGGLGQLLDEAGGDGAGARKEIINFGNFAMIEAGFGRFSRPTVGRVGDQPIGGLPKAEDFKTSAELLVETPAETITSPAVRFRGEVHPSIMHAMAAERVVKKFGLSDEEMGKALKSGEYADGYVTSTGRFVTRPEALAIAEGGDIGHGPNSVGTVLKGEAVSTPAAHIVAATERNLRDLWDERGIHPAEAVHDAQSDAFVRRDITKPSIEAFHGSAHDFDRFDIGKVGIGEGRQSYGHGLYFAENAKVAESYLMAGKTGADTGTPEVYARAALRDGQSSADLRKEAETQRARGSVIGDHEAKFYDRAADMIDRGEITSPSLYQVRINADPSHFLDWDKPLSEQSPQVRDAVLSTHPGATPEMTGQQIYEAVGQKVADVEPGSAAYEAGAGKQVAAQALRDAGIPGIKYLDQGSRDIDPRIRMANNLERDIAENRALLKDASGSVADAIRDKISNQEKALAGERAAIAEHKATSNFVVFDHDLIEITHKNGIALKDMALDDAIEASQGAGLLDRARELGTKAMLAADKVGLTDPDAAWVPAYEAGRLLALGADVTGEVMPTLAQQPPPRPGRLAAAVSAAADKLFDIGRDIQMKVAPMATGTRDTMALAKDFANTMRRNRWEWSRIDDDVAGRFDAAQRKRMWDAADEESVARQLGESREHQGLITLTEEERAAVEDLQARAQTAWLKAVDLGMVEGEGLPAYTPRFVLNVGNPHAGNGPIPLNGMGKNLRVRTPQMRRRNYMTAEETEAAAKRLVGDRAARELKSLDEINAEMADVQIARDIRALPLATAHLEDAIAGRTLIDNIKEYGKRTGDETVTEGARPGDGWFTIDHPAFRTWKPKFEEVDGAVRAVKDADGNTIFEQVPIYVRGDFEGPLRAVLTQPSGATYQAFMALKGKTMSMIMNSPMIHNAVEWGRALPAMPGKVATFRVYFEGNRAKNDVPTMREAIDGGLVPIGKRFFNQDITSIMEAPDLTPGRSWTAKVLAAVPALFDEAAGTAVKRAVDKAGDFWHNTLLWDRIADLQMGLYVNFRDDAIAKGVARQDAVRMAAHWANRYAGALPQEAMSDAARKVSNVLMFSRSFTLGNLGAMKDMFTGLPKDVLAQIERDAGFRAGSINEAGELNGPEVDAVRYAKTMARRKAMAIVGLDIALMYVGNSLLQSGLNVLVGDPTLGEELHGYAQRFVEKMQSIREHPLELLQPFGLFQSISSTADNEPGRENRIHVGQTKDGTAIYARNPMGKIGEEFEGYMTGPLDMMRRKLGTIARPAWQIMSNDAGFGRKVYDPTADTPAKYLKNIAAVIGHLVKSQFPEGQFDAAYDLVKGDGDAKLSAMQAFGPIAGVTFSKGAPGGPAVGELYHAREQHNFQINAALPDIRKQFQRGDIAGARQRMNELMIPPGLQRFYEQTSINPSTARLRGRTLSDFYQYATPEQRERLDRARAR